jgi:hypothetical protein
VQTSLTLLQNKRVGSGADDADCLSWVLHTGHLDNLGSIVLNLLNEIGITKLVLGKRINVCNGLASRRSGDEFDLIPFNVFDDHDLQLRQEMQGKVVDSISKDGFLDQENIASGFLDLLAERKQVLTFFFQDFVHLSVIIDDNLVVHLSKSGHQIQLGNLQE